MLLPQGSLLASDNLQLRDWAQRWWPWFQLHSMVVSSITYPSVPGIPELHSLLWKLPFYSYTFDLVYCLFFFFSVHMETFLILCLLSFPKNCQWPKWPGAGWKPSELYWGAFWLFQEFLRKDLLHKVHADSSLMPPNYTHISCSVLYYSM